VFGIGKVKFLNKNRKHQKSKKQKKQKRIVARWLAGPTIVVVGSFSGGYRAACMV
jgi:hypothetical protein